ncbi:transposase [Hymenobacter sp. BT594]|uniref:Transposase n=1 Tax=Hymenobacter guriensis TaxID=2793065 RepID=A0ABS0KZ12_9BACT|nr:transposase [Hymenobacter guriensis]
MATIFSGISPDKQRKYDKAFKAEALRLASESRSTQAVARQLGISPKLLYRWQQAQLVAEVGSEEVARAPEVRALRSRLKRAEQELDVYKQALVSKALRRALVVRRPPAGLVVHSAQGSQYTATRFKQLLRQRPRRIVLELLQSRTARRRLLLRPGRGQARNQPPHRLLQRRAAAFCARLPCPIPLRNSSSNNVPTLSGLARPPQIAA